jgi:hypothetical protein
LWTETFRPATSSFDAKSGNSSGFDPPIAAHVVILVKVFLKNVDPFIRIIHKPSFLLMLDRYLGMVYKGCPLKDQDIASSSRDEGIPEISSFKPLLFSLLYAATISIHEDNFQQLFPGSFTSCHVLTSEYRKATELALAEVDFVQTNDMIALQEMTIFLVSTSALF